MPVTVLNKSGRRISARPIHKAARAALNLEGIRRAEVSVVLTTDAGIQLLNCGYRGIDNPTDVLSFPQRGFSDKPAPALPAGLIEPLGDVVVSVDRAEAQARKRGHSLQDELSLLVIHGILHLLGYDDESEPAAAVMRDKERRALALIGVETAGLVMRTLG